LGGEVRKPHGRADISVFEQFLHRSQVNTALHPLGGSEMSEIKKSNPFYPD